MIRKLVLCAVIITISFTLACRKTDKFEPSKLISPLSSGQSLQAVQRALEWDAGSWEVLNDRRPLSSDKRPPFRILEISKKGWSHLGMSGELVLTFYNDRLMTAQFYPADLDQYKGLLTTRDQITFSEDGDAKIPPETRVWIGKDASGRRYVGWIDKKLQGEHDNWVKIYS